jgi:hypothetical protein
MSPPRSSLKLWRASTFTSTSVFEECGEAHERRCRRDTVSRLARGKPWRGRRPGEDRPAGAGNTAHVGYGSRGCSNPWSPIGDAASVWSCRCLRRSGQVELRTRRRRRPSGWSKRSGSGQRRGSASVLSIRWLAAVAAERFGVRSRASDSLRGVLLHCELRIVT